MAAHKAAAATLSPHAARSAAQRHLAVTNQQWGVLMPAPACAGAAAAAAAARSSLGSSQARGSWAPLPVHSPLALLAWLGVATFGHMCVGVGTVLFRYLQVNVTPKFPPLRLFFVANLLCLPLLALGSSLPLALLRWSQRRRRRHAVATAAAAAASPAADSSGGGKDLPPPAALAVVVVHEGGKAAGEDEGGALASSPPPPPDEPCRSSARAGCWHRAAALAAVGLSFAATGVLLTVAPGMVDAALVMLVLMFTVLAVALATRVVLRAPLPRVLLPCAALMIAGAAMVRGGGKWRRGVSSGCHGRHMQARTYTPALSSPPTRSSTHPTSPIHPTHPRTDHCPRRAQRRLGQPHLGPGVAGVWAGCLCHAALRHLPHAAAGVPCPRVACAWWWGGGG